MKQVNQVGVDVDSEALVCAMKRAGQRLPLARFANSAAGHQQFIRWATKGGCPVRVCLEATGIYSLQMLQSLSARLPILRESGQTSSWCLSTRELVEPPYRRKANGCCNTGMCTFWRDVAWHQLGRCSSSS